MQNKSPPNAGSPCPQEQAAGTCRLTETSSISSCLSTVAAAVALAETASTSSWERNIPFGGFLFALFLACVLCFSFLIWGTVSVGGTYTIHTFDEWDAKTLKCQLNSAKHVSLTGLLHLNRRQIARCIVITTDNSNRQLQTKHWPLNSGWTLPSGLHSLLVQIHPQPITLHLWQALSASCRDTGKKNLPSPLVNFGCVNEELFSPNSP